MNAPSHQASAIIGVKADINTSRGSTDAGGDLYGAFLVLRDGKGQVAAMDAVMSSTARSNPYAKPLADIGRNDQRDTARATLTVGREGSIGRNADGAIYATAGQFNGPALDALRDFKNTLHGIVGLGPARESPSSGPPADIIGVSGRLDMRAYETSLRGPIAAQIVGTIGGNLRSDLRDGHASAYVFLGNPKGKIFHPSLPGTPEPDNRGTGLYAGIRGTATQYNAATDAQGTRPFTALAEVGAIANIGRKIGVFGGYEMPLTPSVRYQTTPSVPSFKLGAIFRF